MTVERNETSGILRAQEHECEYDASEYCAVNLCSSMQLTVIYMCVLHADGAAHPFELELKSFFRYLGIVVAVFFSLSLQHIFIFHANPLA